MDAEGFARVEIGRRAPKRKYRQKSVAEARGLRPSKMRPEFLRALAKAGERDLMKTRSPCSLPPGARSSPSCAGWPTSCVREVNGDEVTYVVNRNINYTNLCYFRCRFCAFSKGPKSLNLRGDPYLLDTTEVARRAREAWEKGATEVCMVGGIHGSFTGLNYLEYLRAVKEEVPEMHVHAFTPLEVWQGAQTLGISIEEFLKDLKDAGLGTLPGTAAEILDDEIRAIICPDKINTQQWSDVMRAAHATGLQATTTIMFGHVDGSGKLGAAPAGPARHPGRDRRLYRVRAAAVRPHGRAALSAGPLAPGTDVCRDDQDARRRADRAARLHRQRSGLVGQARAMEGAKLALQSGCNDLGGTLMNESISRAAGASHGQEMLPEELENTIREIGRTPTPEDNTLRHAEARVLRGLIDRRKTTDTRLEFVYE